MTYQINPDDPWQVLLDGKIVATCETPGAARRFVAEKNRPPAVDPPDPQDGVVEWLAQTMGMRIVP